MTEYIIVGDGTEYKDCLVYVCGSDKTHAEQLLNRMLTSPTKDDLSVMQGLTNFRVEEVNSEDCWWNNSTN